MSAIALFVPTERGCICAVDSGMNQQNKKEQEILRRAAVMAIGRALRHEYESKQEEIPTYVERSSASWTLRCDFESQGRDLSLHRLRSTSSWNSRASGRPGRAGRGGP
jgi:hypothetical protein